MFDEPTPEQWLDINMQHDFAKEMQWLAEEKEEADHLNEWFRQNPDGE
jgi:hypothetical protein